MNAPLPEAIRQALASVSLDDKYTLDRGRAYMSGIQALVRLPLRATAPPVSTRAALSRVTVALPWGRWTRHYGKPKNI